MNKPNSRAICVLGMHRSGTSAITRAINLLGADLGNPEKLLPPNGDNQEGYWEYSDIVTVHEKILGALTSHWDTTTPLPDQWWENKKIEPFRRELEEIVVDQFMNKPLWLWKDPRTCLLLPLWQEILKKLEIEVSYVICFRNPVDVMMSLHRRNNFGSVKSYGIWSLYTLSSLFWTLDSKRVIFRYDSFLDDWEPCLRRVSNILSIPWPENDSELRSEMINFIKPSLRHNHSSGDLSIISELPKPVLSTYLLCLDCETSQEYSESIKLKNEVNIQYSDYFAYYELQRTIEPTAKEFQVVEVFWTTNGVFTQDRSYRKNIRSDGEFHEYLFDIDSEISQLRVDPTNFWASFVDINSIELLKCNDEGPYDSLVSWSEATNFMGLSLGDQCRLLDRGMSLLILAIGDDPNIILNNIPEIASDIKLKCKIVIKVIKIDESIFQLLIKHLNTLDQLLEQTYQEILFHTENDNLEKEKLSQKNKELALRDDELYRQNKFIEGLVSELDTIKLKVAQAEKQLTINDKELARVSEEARAIKHELVERTNILSDTEYRLNSILSSKSWRYTEWFRRIKRMLF